MRNLLTPQRLPGETFAEYRERRAAGNKAVKAHLRGRVVHQSLEIVHRDGKVGVIPHTYRKGDDVS